MKFGLLYEMQRPHTNFKVDYSALIEETLEQCVLADEVGFDYLWFVEHHFLTTFSGSSAPEVIISALARMTDRIRLVPRQPKEKIVYRRRLIPVLASRTAAKSGTDPM